MPFDLIAARKAGGKDEEILSYLKSTRPKFNFEGALNAGGTLDGIVDYFNTTETKPSATRTWEPEEETEIPFISAGIGTDVEMPKTETIKVQKPIPEIPEEAQSVLERVTGEEPLTQKIKRVGKAGIVGTKQLAQSQLETAEMAARQGRIAEEEPASRLGIRRSEIEKIGEPKQERQLTEQEKKDYLEPGVFKRIATGLDKIVPKEWEKEVAEKSGLTNPLENPEKFAEAAFNMTAQNIPILVQQFGLNAIPVAGQVIAPASMMSLEAGNFLKTAEAVKPEGMSTDEAFEWQRIIDEYAPSYGVLSGTVEYIGNAFGVLRGAGKTLSKPSETVIKKIAKEVGGILGEGVEEATQAGAMNVFMNKAINDMRKKYPDFMPEWTPESKLENFAAGVVVSAITRGGTKVVSKTLGSKAQEKTVQEPELKETRSTVEIEGIKRKVMQKEDGTEVVGVEIKPELEIPELETELAKAKEQEQAYGEAIKEGELPLAKEPAQTQIEPTNEEIEQVDINEIPEPKKDVKKKVYNFRSGRMEVNEDNMSGLPDNNTTKTYIANAKTEDTNKAYGQIDGDKFKAVNDIFGHAEGDRVIGEIGKAIKKFFPESEVDFAGREGGEEYFIDFGNDITDETIKKAKDLIDYIGENIKVGPEKQPFSISMGIGKGTYTEQNGTKNTIADRALYAAKKSRNTLAIDNNGKIDYYYGKEIGEKKYLTEFAKIQLKENLDELVKSGRLEQKAADEFWTNKINAGQVRTVDTGTAKDVGARSIPGETIKESQRQETPAEQVTEPSKVKKEPSKKETTMASMAVNGFDNLNKATQKYTPEKTTEPKQIVPAKEQKSKFKSYSSVSKLYKNSGKKDAEGIKASVNIGQQIESEPKEKGKDSGYLTAPEKSYFKAKDIAYPLIKIEKILKENGIDIKESESIKLSIDQTRGAPGIAKQYIEDNLESIYNEFKGNGQLADELSKYLVAKRTQWLYENKEEYTDVGLSKEDADKMIITVESGNHPYSEQIQKSAKLIWDYGKGLLDIKQKSNIIDDDFRENLKEPYYVPFYRDIESKTAFKVPVGSKFTATSKGIRRIKGSESGYKIIDPLQNIIAQTYETIINAKRAEVANRIIDLAEKHKDIGDMITKLPSRWHKAGTIEHRIEIDNILTPEIENFAKDLGVKITPKGKMGKKIGEYRPETNEMRLLYAATEKTKAHELGHAIHTKYKSLFNEILKNNNEMEKISESRYEGQEVPQNYINYTKKDSEKIAEFISLYITARNSLQEIAPKSFEYFEEKIKNNKQLSKLKEMKPSNVKGIKNFNEDNWVMDNSIPRDEDVFSVLRNGKLVHYRAPLEVALAVKNLHPEQLPTLLKIITLPTKALRAGAVGYNIDFFIPNVIRDQFDAGVRGKSIPIASALSGLKSYLAKDEIYQNFMRHGGAMESTEAGTRGLTVGAENIIYGNKYGKFIDPYWWKKKGALRGTGDLSLYLMKYPFERIRDLAEISEMASRVGAYKYAIKKGESKEAAASVARSAGLDFQRFGYNGRTPNQIFPFINAAMEGIDQTRISIKENPKRMLLNSFVYVVSPLIGLFLWNRENKEYKNISSREKANNWIIMKDKEGKEYWKIPKGHIIKLIGNPLQRALEQAYGTMIGSWKDYAFDLVETVSPIDLSGLLPPALKLVFEPVANYDYYWDREIEKSAVRALPRGQRFDKNTSETLKLIGKSLNISPAMMNHEIKTLFAGTGRNILTAMDWLLGKVGMAKPTDISEDRMPILRRFKGKAEDWKSDLSAMEREVNRRNKEIEKLSLGSLVKYYGYSIDEAKEAYKMSIEEKEQLYKRKKNIIKSRKWLNNLENKLNQKKE